MRERGGVPRLSVLLREYAVGEKVAIVINPSFHSGMPHRRYHGRTATIVGKRGECYIVKVNLGDKEKTLIVAPYHLKPLESSQKAVN